MDIKFTVVNLFPEKRPRSETAADLAFEMQDLLSALYSPETDSLVPRVFLICFAPPHQCINVFKRHALDPPPRQPFSFCASGLKKLLL